MANGLSQNWRTDGPTSRTAQAAYLAQQQQATCSHAEPRHYCPKHAYRGCPEPLTAVTRACGHEVKVVLDRDPHRAMTEIEQLVTGDCGPCVRARRATTRTILWSEVR